MDNYETYGEWRLYYSRTSLIPFLVLSPLSYLFIFQIENIYLKFTGLIMLLPIFLNIKYWWKVIHTPVLSLKNNIITTCNDFGKINVVKPIESYSLVISIDYLGFRKEGEQDIMVDKKYFNEYEWFELVETLKKLPFKELIQGAK